MRSRHTGKYIQLRVLGQEELYEGTFLSEYKDMGQMWVRFRWVSGHIECIPYDSIVGITETDKPGYSGVVLKLVRRRGKKA